MFSVQYNEQESLFRERYMINSTNIRLDNKYFEVENVLKTYVVMSLAQRKNIITPQLIEL